MYNPLDSIGITSSAVSHRRKRGGSLVSLGGSGSGEVKVK